MALNGRELSACAEKLQIEVLIDVVLDKIPCVDPYVDTILPQQTCRQVGCATGVMLQVVLATACGFCNRDIIIQKLYAGTSPV